MEQNTVLLDVEKHNELRDFKLNIEKGNTLYVSVYYDHHCYPYSHSQTFITESEAVKKLTDNVKELKEIIYDLRNPKEKEIGIMDIKRMSYWEFRKWRKS